MNPDDFEKHLQRQPLRQVPGEWREEILSAARQASLPQHAPRTTHHAPPSPSLLSTLHPQLSTLLWPHPAAWAGLAAVWLVILGLNLTTRDASPRLAKHAVAALPAGLHGLSRAGAAVDRTDRAARNAGGGTAESPPAAAQKRAAQEMLMAQSGKPQPNCAKRLECAELAPAFDRPAYDSASKLDALQTLRAAVHHRTIAAWEQSTV